MTKDTAFGNNGDSSLSSKHIRFDDKSVTKNDILPSNKKRKNKKRKRNANNTDTATTNDKKTSACNKQLFNGLILAISTLESKQTNTTSSSTTTIKDSSINNKTLKQTLISHGATISPQVHKKVHYLIATDSAIQNLTQRVRQAYKRNVDIVNVNWIDECIKKNTTKKCTRVDVEAYLCNELVKTLIGEKEREKKKQKSNGGDDGNTSDIPNEDNNGWSTPIELDCCCVCHENGDDNCLWCTGPENTCNLTLARLAKKQQCTKV